MLSLAQRFDLLRADLMASPPRISVFANLPFAMLVYEPENEWNMRAHARTLETQLRETGQEVEWVSLAALLWEIVEKIEGIEAIADLEERWGFEKAQEQINRYLTQPTLRNTLPDTLANRLSVLDKEKQIVFLYRAGIMAPEVYHVSTLLDQMQGRTEVTTILFYPGTAIGEHDLRFMDLEGRETSRNYRGKPYF